MSYYLKHHLSSVMSLPDSVKSKIKQSHKILDIGCGNGALKKLFPQNKMLGVDKSQDSIKLSLKAGYERAEKINIEKQKLPFRTNSIDFAICNHVLEHLLYPLFAVQEIHRVLKPGGYLFISVPTVKNSKYYDDYTHIRPFTEHSLRVLLKDAGFKNLKLIFQLRGILGLGILENIFDFKIQKYQEKIAEKLPYLKGTANVEILAKKTIHLLDRM